MVKGFSSAPICQLNNDKGAHATGWICSPDGYIMGPSHLFTDKGSHKQIIDLRDSSKTAESYDVYYQGKTCKASLVYAYKNEDEHMDFAILKMKEAHCSYEYYPVTIQCNPRDLIHMAGYGDVVGNNALTIAEGHYVYRTEFKNNKDFYLLKVSCQDAVQYGFSGSPVYVDKDDAVVGMQIGATKIALDSKNQRLAEKKSIFAISMRLILQRFPFMRNILVLKGVGESGCIIPEQLITDISDGNCILFVGAGCSFDADLPTWKELLEALIDETYRRAPPDDETRQEIEQLLAEGKDLVVAQYCRSKLREYGFSQLMKKQMSSYDHSKAETHKILSTIKFKAILTTNFDTLVEDFFLDENATVYTAQEFEKALPPMGKTTPIIKIHGTLDKPKSIVLTGTDYRKTIFGNINFRNYLKGLFQSSTVLFVGYSFADKNISLLLQELLTSQPDETRMHYAIMANTGNIMNNYFLEDMNVFVLSLKTRWNAYDQLHSVLNDLVTSLPPHAIKM